MLYVDSGGVSANRHVRVAPSPATWASPVLLVAVHRSGTSAVIAKTAFRSGWSKQANTRRASSGSNVVHT